MFDSFTEEAKSVVEDAASYAQQLGATSVGTEHILLGLLHAEQRRRSGALFARGVTPGTLMPALLEHLGHESAPAPSSDRPTSLTPQALRAFQMAHLASGDSKVDTTALLKAMLDLPGWSGYDVLQQAGIDLASLRVELGLPAIPPYQAGTLIRFPDGTAVSAASLAQRREGNPDRDFGLYLDPRWCPTWPAVLVDWPDFDVPADDQAAAHAITAAFERAQQGQRVEVGCAGGLGRTGTVLACMATLAGVDTSEAVSWVRRHYHPAAIETDEQAEWVQRFAAQQLGTTPCGPKATP